MVKDSGSIVDEGLKSISIITQNPKDHHRFTLIHKVILYLCSILAKKPTEQVSVCEH